VTIGGNLQAPLGSLAAHQNARARMVGRQRNVEFELELLEAKVVQTAARADVCRLRVAVEIESSLQLYAEAGVLGRCAVPPHHIADLQFRAVRVDGLLFIPVGVQLWTALLHQDRVEVTRGVEGQS
jgi:hypothetical protein